MGSAGTNPCRVHPRAAPVELFRSVRDESASSASSCSTPGVSESAIDRFLYRAGKGHAGARVGSAVGGGSRRMGYNRDISRLIADTYPRD